MPRRMPAYGQLIRYLRESEGLSEAELAQRIGEADYYVGYLENGYRTPRPRQVERLAEAFSWEPFEFALLADVEIPYPDWPRLDDLNGWRDLANRWARVADAVSRYALARELFTHPAWQEAVDPNLPTQVAEYGMAACYGWVRSRWETWLPDPVRLRAPEHAEALVSALAAGGSRLPPVAEPDFLRGLTPTERATVETVARSLRAQRPDGPSADPTG